MVAAVRLLTTIAGDDGFRAGVAATTFGLGLRHGIDLDHIAALTDITSSPDTPPRRSMLLATLYAVGHGLVVFVLGCAIILFADELPAAVDRAMGRVVGATLVALGAYVVYGLVRHGRAFRMRSRWMVVFLGVRRGLRWVRGRQPDELVIEHEHEHSVAEAHTELHAHDHVLAPVAAARGLAPTHRHAHRHVAQLPEDPFASYGAATSFGVGMIHGVGAETPTQVLIFVTAAGAVGQAGGVALLLAFIAGLVTANTGIALASTFGFLRASKTSWAYTIVSIIVATFSLALGALYLVT
jgi:high-affinity nickel-transport protein